MVQKIEPLSTVVRQLVFHIAVILGALVAFVAAVKFVWGLV